LHKRLAWRLSAVLTPGSEAAQLPWAAALHQFVALAIQPPLFSAYIKGFLSVDQCEVV
jgi:hypothetical protein